VRGGRRIGVLYSGGLDSAALVGFYLRRGFRVFPVYVRSGLRWEEDEIRRARGFLRRVSSPSLMPITFARLNLEHAYGNNWSHTGKTPRRNSDDRDVFLPGRNLLLTTKALLALSRCRVSTLALATLKGNPFPDAKPRYFRRLETIYSAGFRRRIRIRTPFLKWTKGDVIRESKGFPLHLSLSCISPKRGGHCGECNKCAERQRAFSEAEVRDLTIYARSPESKRSS